MKKFFKLNTNFIRRWTITLLVIIETLNEFRTGKPCLAGVKFCWNIGLGYHRRIEEYSMVEFYLMPFTLVTITTFFKGGVMQNATHETNHD